MDSTVPMVHSILSDRDKLAGVDDPPVVNLPPPPPPPHTHTHTHTDGMPPLVLVVILSSILA
jgi:hypothetical protein